VTAGAHRLALHGAARPLRVLMGLCEFARRFTLLPPASRSMLASVDLGSDSATPPVLETDDAIVLVLGAPGGSERPGYLEGVTRLEKLLFLLERETPLRDWLTEKADFRSHRFGPFSSKIYQAVDTLAAAQMVRDSAKGAPTTEDRWEALNVLMDDEDVDPYTTRTFELTERGRRYYGVLIEELPVDAERTLATFKSRFAHLPLRQLVRYVYERYPQFTDKSEIRDEILG
jgi:uncharacterized protein